MAIFKTPRITTLQRLGLTLEDSEIVFDTDQKIFYGGNGSNGGFPIGSGIGSNVEMVVLTQQDISNKFIVLNDSPLFPGGVELTPGGGIPQINGIDFSVTGNILSWDGLGLDGNFLEQNEILIVKY
jgi:hypothetical protein